jgi:xylan 1,4-beta-xylosidase
MHPDPTVCRVGRDFYLACSSFEYFPGVPIFHSRDLVHWRQLGHVLTRRSQLDLTGCPSSGGIYAPTLRHHDGTFHLVTTLVGRGNFLVTARDAHGPWSDPEWLDDDGIDPSLAFLDGRVLYTRNGPGSDPDHPFVYQAELGAGRPRVIWRGLGGVWPEAPHLYKRGEWYYLVTAEGGTSYDHSVVVARSRDAFGPFAPSPHGPLLTHRDRPRHPVQATGHADLVDLEDGTTWAVLLGIRPRGGRRHHLGRETFLAPVDWGADGWPRMSRVELRLQAPLPAAPQPPPPTRTVFTGDLPPEWVFVREPGAWSADGSLRLRNTAVYRRQQHFDLTARARLAGGDGAGICVRASDAFHAALVVTRGEARLVRTSRGRTVTLARTPVAPGAVTLEVRASADRYVFACGTELGSVSTGLFSAEHIHAATGRHHFTGAMLGLVAGDAPAEFEWFEYEAA